MVEWLRSLPPIQEVSLSHMGGGGLPPDQAPRTNAAILDVTQLTPKSLRFTHGPPLQSYLFKGEATEIFQIA
jgi:hypothetical protein